MYKFSLAILPFLSVLILTACGEVEEAKSDISILMSEHENELPLSELKPANSQKSKKILANLPELLSTLEYSYLDLDIKDVSSVLKISKIIQSGNHVDVYVEYLGSGGKIHLLDSTCTKFGFFKCGGWSSFLYTLKDDDSNNKYQLSKLNNLKISPSYIKKNFSEASQAKMMNAMVSGSIQVNNSAGIEFLKLDTLEDKNFILAFDGVKNRIKRFDINEGYDGTWHFKNLRLDLSIQEQQYINDFKTYLKQFELDKLSIDTLSQLYSYTEYPQIQKLIARSILTRELLKNSIADLHQFNLHYKKHMKLVEESVAKIFELVEIKDSVSGYEWFISHYSSTSYAKKALDTIHKIMFGKAKKVNTIASYNSFVFSYPTAKQINQANELAYEMEKEVYTELGVLSFWDTDHKKEKKSRKFLIKAKQIERFPRDNELRGNRKSGYLIVADRMYSLLQEEFDDSEATLRHLESQEFKDFVSDFKSIMRDIKYTLEKIEDNSNRISRYTEEMISVAKEGFSDAKADRAMTAYYEKKKTEWDKLMHYKDTGYN